MKRLKTGTRYIFVCKKIFPYEIGDFADSPIPSLFQMNENNREGGGGYTPNPPELPITQPNFTKNNKQTKDFCLALLF